MKIKRKLFKFIAGTSLYLVPLASICLIPNVFVKKNTFFNHSNQNNNQSQSFEHHLTSQVPSTVENLNKTNEDSNLLSVVFRQNKPTGIVDANNLTATYFNFSTTPINEALDDITPNFILANKNKIFTGDYKLNTGTEITIVKKEIENNNIKITIDLAPNTWYNEQGQLGTTKKRFNFVIKDFKVLENNDPSQPPGDDSSESSKKESGSRVGTIIGAILCFAGAGVIMGILWFVYKKTLNNNAK